MLSFVVPDSPGSSHSATTTQTPTESTSTAASGRCSPPSGFSPRQSAGESCTGQSRRRSFVSLILIEHKNPICNTNKFFIIFPSSAAHNLDASIDWNGQIRVPISAYIRHPKFTFRLKDETPFNDIGLVKLQYPVNSSATADPVGPWGTICLPRQDSTYNGQLGNLTSVAGWGWTRPGDSGSGSSVLRKLENFPVVSTDWCKEKYSIDDYDQANSIVCTYSEGRDTCMVSGKSDTSKI